MFYRQEMDFLAAGRSFLEDMHKFTTRNYVRAVHSLLDAMSDRSNLHGTGDLQEMLDRIGRNRHESSCCRAFWVNEYLVHRRGGDGSAPFYASLKLKSERTVGAEDFSKEVRKSWNMGYGILPVKVTGKEYSRDVLVNYDWHALPGLTEEWRTDPLPLEGGAQASLPGKNKVSGVLSDGVNGMGIYHHLPGESYSAATGFKSYHFIEDKIISQGSGIGRIRPGQGRDIVTFIDQTAFSEPLVYCVGGRMERIEPGESVNLAEEISSPCWLYHGGKGYVIFPEGHQQLLIRTGKEINVTDGAISNGNPGFVIALNHGADPGCKWDDSYLYVQLPGVSLDEMPARFAELQDDLSFSRVDGIAHAAYSEEDLTWQFAFFRTGAVEVGGIRVESDDAAEIQLRMVDGQWMMAVNNPAPDGQKQTLQFTVSADLPEGTYGYVNGGIRPLEGETVSVVRKGNLSHVTVELPDIRDAAGYNFQSYLYAAVPIVINFGGRASGFIHP